MGVDKHCVLESSKLCKKLFQLKTDSILTDITIICHGKVISAHKCILAASSQFFKTLFCQDSAYMCGYFQSCDFTDQIDYDSADFLEKIIDFMYSRTIIIDDINVAVIAKLAFFFVVDDLLETCYQFVNSAVTIKNCINLYVRLNQIPEFQAGPIYLQSLDTTIDMLKVPYDLIQSRFHDVYIQSDALVNTQSDDLVQLLSKGVAKSCTIDSVVKFVIRWLQLHPKDEGFEVASLLLDYALEKSRIPMLGAVSSWLNVTSMYDKIEAVLVGSAINQAYQTGLLTKMSAILEQLDSQDYTAIKEKEINGEDEANPIVVGKVKTPGSFDDSEHSYVKEEEGRELDEGDRIPKKEIISEDGMDDILGQSGSSIGKEGNEKVKSDSGTSNCVCGLDMEECKKCKDETLPTQSQEERKRVSCKACKLEFKARRHLDNHIKRVHSKKGILTKIRGSKSKGSKASTKGNKMSDIKTIALQESKDEMEGVKNNVHKTGESERKEKSAKQSKDKKKHKKLYVDKDGTKESDKAHEDDNNVDDNKDGMTIDSSSTDDYSESTTDNEPVDEAGLYDEARALDEDSFMGTGMSSADIDKLLENLMELQCFQCKKVFKDKHELKEHLRCHSDLRPFKCETCDMTFKRNSHLRRHKQSHTDQKLFQCILCQIKFEDNDALKLHLKTHSADRPFSCVFCQRAYKDENDFVRHSLMHAQTDQLFKCNLCDKTFRRKYHLKRHTLIHQGKIPRKHKCPHCLESFSRVKALTKHLPKHNGEPGVLEVYETPRTSHTCEVCGYAFSDVNNLVRHIRVHTGEKPYDCDICGKAFSQKGQLNIHKLTHGGTRQYQCERCPKLFLTNSGLHKHRRQVHSNYRPYRCEYCGKQFLQKSDLHRHVPMHTGEKNYQCDICAMLFARKDKLVSHYKQDHMQELQ